LPHLGRDIADGKAQAEIRNGRGVNGLCDHPTVPLSNSFRLFIGSRVAPATAQRGPSRKLRFLFPIDQPGGWRLEYPKKLAVLTL
jgi:hypothetical protein